MNPTYTVVGLGSVEPNLVLPYLGDNVRFINNPTDEERAQAHGCIVRAAYDVTREVIEAMPHLRVIARTGVGTERVDKVAAAERSIPVVITPGSNARAVAEHAFAMMLALIKRLGEAQAYVAHGQWGASPVPVPGDVYQKTLAIIGYGRIGHQLAEFGKAFGMRMVVHDPFVQSSEFENVTLEEAVAQADVISLHVPGGGGELLTKELLSTAKPGLLIVNCARAELISTETLVDSIASGVIGGAALDVFTAEPVVSHPLATHPSVLLSPHSTGLSSQAIIDTFRMAAEGVADVFAGRTPAHTAG